VAFTGGLHASRSNNATTRHAKPVANTTSPAANTLPRRPHSAHPFVLALSLRLGGITRFQKEERLVLR